MGQFTTLTPDTYLDPSTRSASPAAFKKSGRYFGSWEKSASISKMRSKSRSSAQRKPARLASVLAAAEPKTEVTAFRPQ